LPDFSWHNFTQTVENIPMATKLPNGRKIYQPFPFQGPPKFTQIVFFLFENFQPALAAWCSGYRFRQ
jgi:hypothetical protein